MSVKVFFNLSGGERRECIAEIGQSLLAVAQANGIDLEGACEGSLACATCHVVIDPEWYAKLTPPNIDELEMLDLAKSRKSTSRLGCQIKLTEAMNGMTVRV